jgi:hypothetical protein
MNRTLQSAVRRACCTAAVLALPVAIGAQTRTIRGLVVDTVNHPLSRVDLSIESSAGQIWLLLSDTVGRFRLAVGPADSVFSLSARLIGFAPERRSFRIPTLDSVFDMTVVLRRATARTLPTVRAVVQRRAVIRESARGQDVSPGGSGESLWLLNGLGGDLAGSATAAMTGIQGVSVTRDQAGTYQASVFGADPSQNSTLLNGTSVINASLPRDGVSIGVRTTTYDPGKGGFAGGLVSYRIPSGTDSMRTTGRISLQAPSLEWSQPPSEPYGFSSEILSGAISGPIRKGHVFHSTSVQLSNRRSKLSSVLDRDTIFGPLRFAADSIARLRAALDAAGIPTSNRIRISESSSLSFLTRLDLTPNASASNNNRGAIVALTAVGGVSTNKVPFVASATASRTRGVHSYGQFQTLYSSYLPGGILNEVTGSFGEARDDLRSPSAFPRGVIDGASLAADSGALPSDITFGEGGVSTNTRRRAGSVRDEVTWYTVSGRHRFRVTIEGSDNSLTTAAKSQSNGVFRFGSISAFMSSSPNSYTLDAFANKGQAAEASGAIALGGIWSVPSHRLQFAYGLRGEVSRVRAMVPPIPSVDSVFRVESSGLPRSTAVLPMAGFTWTVGEFDGGGARLPRGTLVGGIRVYRGTIPLSVAAAVSGNRSDPTATTVACVGEAAPEPQWQQYANASQPLPTQCVGAEAQSPLGMSGKRISLLSRRFAPPQNIRLNFGWSGFVNPDWTVTASLTRSLARNLPQQFELNFNPVPRFSLNEESNRPVFVPTTSVNPATGDVASGPSRRTTSFSSITDLRSDLRSTYGVIGGGVSYLGSRSTGKHYDVRFTLSYAYSRSRSQFYGFSSTSATPTSREWARADADIRHTGRLSAAFDVGIATISLYGTATSGLPYTPRVATDINGDGYANDRAFIDAAQLHLSRSGDASLTASRLPRAALECLRRQSGRIVQRNACEGPWSGTANAAVTSNHTAPLHNWGSVTILLYNLPAVFDNLVHGPNRTHGWGAIQSIDDVLLRVKGFDPVRQRFVYTANTNFGRGLFLSGQRIAPISLAVDFRMSVGGQ